MRGSIFCLFVFSLFLFSGCDQHAAIDAEQVRNLLNFDDPEQVATFEELVEKLGDPHDATSTQLRKLEEMEFKVSPLKALKTDFTTAKIWGNDSFFVAVFVEENGRVKSYNLIGGKGSQKR